MVDLGNGKMGYLIELLVHKYGIHKFETQHTHNCPMKTVVLLRKRL